MLLTNVLTYLHYNIPKRTDIALKEKECAGQNDDISSLLLFIVVQIFRKF